LLTLDRVANYLSVYNKMGSNKTQTQNRNRNKTLKKPRALCQCYDTQNGKGCSRSPVGDSLFCEKHQGCGGSPLSGSEPVRDVKLYNTPAVRKSHNCYSYAMHVYDPKGEELCKKYGSCRNFFHQPGAKTGNRNALNKQERRSCPVVEDLMMGDIPEVTKSTYEAKCPVGMSKVAAVVDKGVDYHWYRQDRDGMWSHKDGSNKVKTYDALKRPIFNPELASRDYRWQGSDLNYEDFCGFYCVPRDHPVVLGRGVNRQSRRSKRKTLRGGQWEVPIPMTLQVGRGTRRSGGGYDIRLNSLPGCPPSGQSAGGYDIRLNSLPGCPPQSETLGRQDSPVAPQGGLGLSWSDYPSHSTDSLRKRYLMDTRSSRRHRK